jgi:hypothetical protein
MVCDSVAHVDYPMPHTVSLWTYLRLPLTTEQIAVLPTLSSAYSYIIPHQTLVVLSGGIDMCIVLSRIASDIATGRLHPTAILSTNLIALSLLRVRHPDGTLDMAALSSEYSLLYSNLMEISRRTLPNLSLAPKPYLHIDSKLKKQEELEEEILMPQITLLDRTSPVSSEQFSNPRFNVGSDLISNDAGSETVDIVRSYGTVSQKMRYPSIQDLYRGYHSLPPLPPTEANAEVSPTFHPL